jgi:hypothetical protein
LSNDKVIFTGQNIVMKNIEKIVAGSKIGECIFMEELDSKVFPKTKTSKRIRTRRIGLFKCNCGNEFKADISLVKKGNTKSCGCLFKQTSKKAKRITHNKTNHPLYNTWVGMIRRCTKDTSISFIRYGAIGIKVCNDWMDVNKFIEDMYPSYKKGLQLDRIDNSGNYHKGNCRWVTPKVNSNNRKDNRIIEYKGLVKTLSEWSDELNIPVNTLRYRLNNWDIEKSFTYKNKIE